MSQRTSFALGIILIAVLSVSIIATVDWWWGNVHSTPEFFVGVEFAYSNNVGDLKNLVDKVKDYTNLFVLGSVDMTFNKTALDESCDYIYEAGLYFLVLFTDTDIYRRGPNSTDIKPSTWIYEPLIWIYEARQKYGDKFWGVYRYDEPGGHQLDQGPSSLLNRTEAAAYGTYSNASKYYVDNLSYLIKYYKYISNEIFTADYGLYWFDYETGYDAVFADFGFNLSRPLQIALCRGAAMAQNRDWGAIVTWTYNDKPYLESGEELYSDLKLAYDSGAKYAIVFSYPKIGPYGTLSDKQGHFDALQNFWDYVHSNPNNRGVNRAEAAYVLPKGYGFGFRRADDTIWGLWGADELSGKVWSDVNKLIAQYGSQLDVVYDDPEFMGAMRSRYDRLFFWNETIS
jgi:hypothetical protein